MSNQGADFTALQPGETVAEGWRSDPPDHDRKFSEQLLRLTTCSMQPQEVARLIVSPQELLIVLLTASIELNCDESFESYATKAHEKGIPASVIAAIRNHTPVDIEKLQELRQFTSRLIALNTWVDQQVVHEFLAAGYNPAAILAVQASICQVVMSNYLQTGLYDEMDNVACISTSSRCGL